VSSDFVFVRYKYLNTNVLRGRSQ